MICTSCHHPNHPDTKYCGGCSAPLGPTAAWGPWEQTQAEGFAIRQATTAERPRLILVLGIWLIFGTMWIVAALILWVAIRSAEWQADDVLMMIVCLGVLVLSTALLYRSTANYRRRKSAQTHDNSNEATHERAAL
jgi:hypothetical protein